MVCGPFLVPSLRPGAAPGSFGGGFGVGVESVCEARIRRVLRRVGGARFGVGLEPFAYDAERRRIRIEGHTSASAPRGAVRQALAASFTCHRLPVAVRSPRSFNSVAMPPHGDLCILA